MNKIWLVILGVVVLTSGCVARGASPTMQRQVAGLMQFTPDQNVAQTIDSGEELYEITKDQDYTLENGNSVHYSAAWSLGMYYYRIGKYHMAYQMLDEVIKNIKTFKRDSALVQQTCFLYGGASKVRLNEKYIAKNIFSMLFVSDGIDHRNAEEKARVRSLQISYRTPPKGTVMLVDIMCKAKQFAVPELTKDVLDAYSEVMPLSAECLERIKKD